MAFYALLASSPKSQRWRTCAIFPAGGVAQAALQARALRDSNSLGFVPHPSKFRMRPATRRELSLLSSYMSSVNNSTLPTFKEEDLDGLLYRRKKLMTSFFMGLFLQPEVMKERYGGGGSSGGNALSTRKGGSGSGGVEAEHSGVEQEASVAEVHEAPPEDSTVEADAGGFGNGDDAPITDSSRQNAALAALEGDLAEAQTEISNDSSTEIDLDFI
tara:strand:+ start:4420 stop:5067 length:648 start_codon:yes stop_codon:yes gene_type:complete